jgi:hypothetical protein
MLDNMAVSDYLMPADRRKGRIQMAQGYIHKKNEVI